MFAVKKEPWKPWNWTLTYETAAVPLSDMKVVVYCMQHMNFLFTAAYHAMLAFHVQHDKTIASVIFLLHRDKAKNKLWHIGMYLLTLNRFCYHELEEHSQKMHFTARSFWEHGEEGSPDICFLDTHCHRHCHHSAVSFILQGISVRQ